MTDKLRWEAKYQAKASGVADPGSPFVLEALAQIGAPSGVALDLAMGEGRHALAAARAGWTVVGLDLAEAACVRVAEAARTGNLPVHPLVGDALAAPFAPARFGLVIVSRFLERVLASWIADALAPGGHLVFETFTTAQPSLGWGPKNPAHLLEPGELPRMFSGLQVVRYEERSDAAHGALASLLARA